MKLKYITVFVGMFCVCMGLGWAFGMELLTRGRDLGFCLLMSILMGFAAIGFFRTEIWGDQ